jgi:capsular polysaccharide biosynthesis protein
MDFFDFINLIKGKKQTIAIVVMIFVLFAVGFTFIQPLRYLSASKVLVIQGLPEKVDSYQISKSNEYIAGLLAQVITTNSFYKEVMNSGFNIDKTYFPESGDKQMKLWKKTVKVNSDQSGIVTIKVYHDNRVQVDQISQGINFILISKNQLYHGFGDLVKIKIIEQPVTSDRPIKPNIFINIGVAFSFGLLVSLTYIYLFPEKRYNLFLTPPAPRSMASSDIRPGQDEFAIADEPVFRYNRPGMVNEPSLKNMNNDVDDRLDANTNANEDIYRKLRGAMTPDNLPIIDEADVDEEELQSINPAEIRPRNFEGQGNMQNIINRPNQRG